MVFTLSTSCPPGQQHHSDESVNNRYVKFECIAKHIDNLSENAHAISFTVYMHPVRKHPRKTKVFKMCQSTEDARDISDSEGQYFQ